MEGHGGPLGILGHLVSVVEVAGQGRLLVFVHQVWVGAVCGYSHRQQAVDDDVCVPAGASPGAEHQLQRAGAGGAPPALRSASLPPDGRREVCIDGRGQTVVVEVAVHARAEVHRLHHAARGQDAQQRVEVEEAVHAGLVQGVRQRLGRVGADLHILEAGGGNSWKPEAEGRLNVK